MASPGAVSLDLYGTLLDFSIERDEPPVVASLLEQAGADRDVGMVLDAWVRASLTERGRTPFRTVRESLAVGADVVADRFGLTIDPLAWARALEDRWVAAPLRDEADEALGMIEALGVPWGIVTNLDEDVLERVLRACGLSERVEAMVSSERARAYKPHPRPFWMLMDRLGVGAGRCVHVGNSRGEDRAGAKAAGLQRCALVGEEGGLADVVGDVLG